MGILNSLAATSFEPAHNSGTVATIYPDALKGKILLVRPLGLNTYPGYKMHFNSHKNWYRVRARSIYKIVLVEGLNQTYDFLEKEKCAGVGENKIRIFFNGHVHKCKDFLKVFPKNGNLKTDKFLFVHHNEI